jgi:hypothetical protein
MAHAMEGENSKLDILFFRNKLKKKKKGMKMVGQMKEYITHFVCFVSQIYRIK